MGIKINVNEIHNQIFKLQSELMKIEEGAKTKVQYITNKINEEFNPKINEIESRLRLEQGKLDEINRILNDCISKKKELESEIKKLKKEEDLLKKGKSKTLNDKLKAISDEKHKKLKSHKGEIKTLEKQLKELSTA